MVYAKLKKDDPRVKAAIGWASRHYTVDENPGLKKKGHFYYILTFTKALAALGDDILTDKNGKKNFWRADVINKLLSMQKGNGSWVNDDGKWMESDALLATPFALLSMEIAAGKAFKN